VSGSDAIAESVSSIVEELGSANILESVIGNGDTAGRKNVLALTDEQSAGICFHRLKSLFSFLYLSVVFNCFRIIIVPLDLPYGLGGPPAWSCSPAWD
jgi:hypothetical protein